MLDAVVVRGAEPEGLSSDRLVDIAAAGISALADYGLAVALIEACAVRRSRRSAPQAALRLAVVGISIFLVNTGMKRLVDRPRPEGPTGPQALGRTPSSSSFPSGHTMAAAASAVALPGGAAGSAAGLAGAGLVGWSRLRLGAHHRSDVIGGFGIGVVLGLALRILLKALERE